MNINNEYEYAHKYSEFIECNKIYLRNMIVVLFVICPIISIILSFAVDMEGFLIINIFEQKRKSLMGLGEYYSNSYLCALYAYIVSFVFSNIYILVLYIKYKNKKDLVFKLKGGINGLLYYIFICISFFFVAYLYDYKPSFDFISRDWLFVGVFLHFYTFIFSIMSSNLIPQIAINVYILSKRGLK